MISPLTRAILLAAVLSTGTCVAQATTITFDGIAPSETQVLTPGATFSEGGYHFSLTSGLAWFLNEPAGQTYATNGTTSLDLGGIVSMTSAAGKPFSVSSIDLATTSALETSTVRLTGVDVNGAQTIRSYTMSGATSANPYGLTTAALAGFDNLVSFEMELVYNSIDTSTYFSLIDNIVIDDGGAAVPEPSTWAMLGLGLAMLAGFARRKFD